MVALCHTRERTEWKDVFLQQQAIHYWLLLNERYEQFLREKGRKI